MEEIIPRSSLQTVVAFVANKDVVTVTTFSRSAAHLLEIIGSLKAKGVKVRFLKQPELSHDNKYAEFMLMVLAGVAQLENAIRAERQAEGISKAKEKGIRFGRKPKLTVAMTQRINELRDANMSIGDIQVATGLGRSTVYRALDG